ncbi:cystathionine beta-lyase [Undibacterium luofuense]|uniref:Cystathionine beta-lyase n=1 Tax=Undibacterium luofuense TaxID=2828733 RepID=A0A941I6V8_9BURK|nr:cystathionine beta-lyase [Undibacterium luofuense]MBR7783101.1 cystathionine beta-lyase [Undibacterium luofuense]
MKNSPQIEKKQLSTRLNHSDYQAPAGFAAYPTAVHHASTVLFENVAAMRSRNWLDKQSYTYGLHGTPTSFTLERRLAEIEDAQHCILAPSGLAAISLIDLALLKSGDHVLIPDNAYSPNKELAHWLQSQFDIAVSVYPPMCGAGIENYIRPETRLIWVEAPGSVSMEIPDLPVIAEVAHRHQIVVALDNTWSAGIVYPGFEHGADIIMQALTKFQSGGSDVLMGAVLVNDAELYKRLQLTHMRLGLGVGMDDVYLVLRGLPTLALRFAEHDCSAREIAAWLKEQPEIQTVLHPALPECPGHPIWQRDFTGAAGLFSVIFKEEYSEQQIDRFVDALALFGIGFSWGGSHSLCVPYRMQGMRDSWTEKGQLVRFYIGLENTKDLKADIRQALQQL